MRITQRLRYLVYSIHMVYIHFRCEVIFGKLLLQVLKCVFSYVLVFFFYFLSLSVQKRHGISTFRFVSVCERLLCTLCVVQCSINLFHLVILFGFDKRRKKKKNQQQKPITNCKDGIHFALIRKEMSLSIRNHRFFFCFNFLVLMVLCRFCWLLFFCL